MNSAKPKKLSRREFAQRAALFSAAVPFIPSSAVLAEQTTNSGQSGQLTNSTLSQQPTTAQQPAKPAVNPAPASQSNEPKLSAEGQKEADSRYQSILSTFGDRFTDQDKSTVRTLCVFLQPSLEHIRSFHLDNGENPALYLKPLVEREKKPQVLLKSAPKSSAKPTQSVVKPGKRKS
jgi:hypothetical protein